MERSIIRARNFLAAQYRRSEPPTADMLLHARRELNAAKVERAIRDALATPEKLSSAQRREMSELLMRGVR